MLLHAHSLRPNSGLWWPTRPPAGWEVLIMVTCSFVRHVLRLTGIALAASMLAAGPALLPAVRPQASTCGPFSSPAAVHPGVVAYVRRSTHDIHLISPDGSGDRVLWVAPRPLALWAPLDLSWRPDGGELAFSGEHREP